MRTAVSSVVNFIYACALVQQISAYPLCAVSSVVNFIYACTLVQQISAHPLCAVSSVANCYLLPIVTGDAFLATPNMARQVNEESFDVLRVIYRTVDSEPTLVATHLKKTTTRGSRSMFYSAYSVHTEYYKEAWGVSTEGVSSEEKTKK